MNTGVFSPALFFIPSKSASQGVRLLMLKVVLPFSFEYHWEHLHRCTKRCIF